MPICLESTTPATSLPCRRESWKCSAWPQWRRRPAASQWWPAITADCGKPFRIPLERASEPEMPPTWPPTWKLFWATPAYRVRYAPAPSKMPRVTTGRVSSSAAMRSTPHYERTTGKHRHAFLQRRTHHRRIYQVDSAAKPCELGTVALRRRFHGWELRDGARV